jgi:hypothetical protein
MSQSVGSSRLSQSDRADPTKPEYNDSHPESRKVRLTERDGVSLRREVQDFGSLDRDRAVSWLDSMDQFDHYLTDKDGVKTVFQNPDGETVKAEKPHRFHPDYGDRQYAKLKDLERGISEDYGKLLHTAMLTFTASAQPDGEPIPPVDHLHELDSSWDAIRRALHRQLEGRRWEYLAILEPHPGDGVNNGYLHIHMAVFVEGIVTTEDFEPVIEAHVRNSDYAKQEAHDLTDDSTISVRHAGADREPDESTEHLDELAIYLAEYLGTYGDDPREAPEHVQAANTVLWATGKQRWRPSNGAQQYMSQDSGDDSDSEWELLGIEKDDEMLPAGPDSGGVDTFETGPPGPPENSIG